MTKALKHSFTFGFIVNPIAGIGGPAANKGSDDTAIQQRARKGDIALRAPARARQFLQGLSSRLKQTPLTNHSLELLVAPNEMGEAYCEGVEFSVTVSPLHIGDESSAGDTQNQAKYMLEQNVDLILFVGGDGTARDVCAAIDLQLPVLGIPSGVKMHSGVFAIAPDAAAELVASLLRTELISVSEQEVRDIDEVAFRQGRVRSQHFGDMLVPSENHFVQHVKQGGMEVEELVLLDMAAEIRARLEQENEPVDLIFGPGSTTHFIQQELGVDATLLGVDMVRFNAEQKFVLLKKDVTALELEQRALKSKNPIRLIITAIGGQGHIIGRGNQQLSPKVLERVSKQHTWVVATKTKLESLQRRPLLMDSGDIYLDNDWAGFISVICGFNDVLLYPLGWQSYSKESTNK